MAASVPLRDPTSLFAAPLVSPTVLGCAALIVISTLVSGCIAWLPSFFVRHGPPIANSFNFTWITALGAPDGSASGAVYRPLWAAFCPCRL
jgi:putative MFS transporter